ncbi:MAG TPA: class I SAM-dependent methyltransferase [Anaerolineaceae bacterium]|nr:class I SAM-dependent methyltransferase [Anaerolineaceae bacterium]
MKQNHSSTTAEGMALVRAIESARPEGKRICYDPIARSLINGFSFRMSKLVIDSGLYNRLSPGALEFITAREHFIDDFLKAGLNEGFDQVIILGAGFDTRAYRIPGIEKARVFEIDHPATQAVKLQRLRKVISPLPAHVTYIPLDFNTQTLEEGLSAHGYDEHAKTLFIWQGVTVYLTAQGVDSTLAFIAGHSALGSAVVFDYFYTEFLSDENRPEVKRLRKTMQMIGEEHIFGIGQDQLERFLSQRGFCQIRNTEPEDLKARYFTGLNAGRAIAIGAAIATARVG